MKPKKNLANIHKLHPMEALGNISAQSGEIRVERIEQRLQPKVAFPHKHDFYHFLYLEKGLGWHEIDFSRFSVERGSLFLVRPGQVHSWHLGSSTKGLVLEFTRTSLPESTSTKELLQSLEDFPSFLVVRKNPILLDLLMLMFEEFEKEKTGHQLALECLLTTFLIQLRRLLGEGGGDSDKSTPFDSFSDLVDLHFRKEHAVEFYARKLNITSKGLTTKTTRLFGKSAGAIILERCLVEAKRLLAYSEFTISEIGGAVGYSDPNYFARLFKKKVGITPGEFRKKSARSLRMN